MEALRRRATRKPTVLGGGPWAIESDFPPPSAETYRTQDGVTVLLRARIVDVQSVLAKSLKPGTTLLHAVRFSTGEIVEARPDGPSEIVKVPTDKLGKRPEKAVTVAEPTKGCPAPLFERAEIRASRVLEDFLTNEQRDDYRHHGAFVAVGADTGHRYAISNRHRPDMMESHSFRSLYDLDEQRPLCVHDWTVPAPEEMLALLLCVSLSGKESAVRFLPDVWEH